MRYPSDFRHGEGETGVVSFRITAIRKTREIPPVTRKRALFFSFSFSNVTVVVLAARARPGSNSFAADSKIAVGVGTLMRTDRSF